MEVLVPLLYFQFVGRQVGVDNTERRLVQPGHQTGPVQVRDLGCFDALFSKVCYAKVTAQGNKTIINL